MAQIPISIVVLTFNEVSNVAACLASCQWCEDVHVLDSGSVDGTVELAQQMGATVHHNAFESFGQQRNWAIDNIPARYKWQFHLDADERLTPALVKEMAREIGPEGTTSQKAAYQVPSKTIFLGRWLRFSAAYPTYQVRFFHRERCRFVDFGHGQREQTEGEIGTLQEAYLHFNFSKGIADWLAKHNKYSTQEAQKGFEIARERAFSWRGLLQGDRVTRRRALKNMSYALPGRAVFRFFYSYFLKSGWRDGLPGLHYCLLMAMYEYWTELKMKELRASQKPQDTR